MSRGRLAVAGVVAWCLLALAVGTPYASADTFAGKSVEEKCDTQPFVAFSMPLDGTVKTVRLAQQRLEISPPPGAVVQVYWRIVNGNGAMVPGVFWYVGPGVIFDHWDFSATKGQNGEVMAPWAGYSVNLVAGTTGTIEWVYRKPANYAGCYSVSLVGVEVLHFSNGGGGNWPPGGGGIATPTPRPSGAPTPTPGPTQPPSPDPSSSLAPGWCEDPDYDPSVPGTGPYVPCSSVPTPSPTPEPTATPPPADPWFHCTGPGYPNSWCDGRTGQPSVHLVQVYRGDVWRFYAGCSPAPADPNGIVGASVAVKNQGQLPHPNGTSVKGTTQQLGNDCSAGVQQWEITVDIVSGTSEWWYMHFDFPVATFHNAIGAQGNYRWELLTPGAERPTPEPTPTPTATPEATPTPSPTLPAGVDPSLPPNPYDPPPGAGLGEPANVLGCTFDGNPLNGPAFTACVLAALPGALLDATATALMPSGLGDKMAHLLDPLMDKAPFAYMAQIVDALTGSFGGGAIGGGGPSWCFTVPDMLGGAQVCIDPEDVTTPASLFRGIVLGVLMVGVFFALLRKVEGVVGIAPQVDHALEPQGKT